MSNTETINLWEAIRQMRKLTSEGKTFSFAHSTFNQDTQISEGLRYVDKASLRPQAKGDDVRDADHKLFFYDELQKLPRVCWQILIVNFNDQVCVLS